MFPRTLPSLLTSSKLHTPEIEKERNYVRMIQYYLTSKDITKSGYKSPLRFCFCVGGGKGT